MLTVHRSASPAALVAALAEVLAPPPADPMALDVVAVPAQGVERWVAQRLSHALGARDDDGVCAAVVFPRPGRLLDDALAAADPAVAAALEAWRPERVVWALLDVLDACPADEAWCAGLRHHLGPDPTTSTRRYGVARRLTRLLTAYAAERPDVPRAWARGDDAGVPDDLAWQPVLWRLLRERVGVPSPAELLEDACAALVAHPERAALPERVSVLGASRLTAARLRVLVALAERRAVHLLVHHASPALHAAVAAAGPAGPRRADAAAAVAVRHPLLASLSRDVRELQQRLAAAAPAHGDEHHEPAPDDRAPGLLGRLQADLAADRVPAERLVLDPADRTVQVHACHGRARQVEVLREVVLGLLADDPTLEPRDVLVLCPDVETFAPLVTAAFGAGTHPAGGLRVSIADRSPRRTNTLLALAARLLELAAGRVTGPDVLDLAGAPPVRRRFRLGDDELEQLRSWTVAGGAHWGLSAEHRRRWGLGHLAQGTWRSAVDRLLVGVAAGDPDAPLGDVLPLDGVDSTDADLAGRCAELLDRLDAALSRLAGPQDVVGWLDALEASVAALGEPAPDAAWEAVQLRRELGEVRAAAAAAGSRAPLTLGDATALLADRLQGRPTRTSFRTGGLTVCTLVPMRSVPHRVVCLLGLDDGAFPRTGLPEGDDLLARDPRVGERDPRSEDRQLLLDALTAAGERLVVTHTAHDVRTGAPLPPAVPLAELLDALDATATTADGRPARAQVVVQHPLQPTDPRCFLPGRLGRPGPLSFDTTALGGARSAAGRRTQPPPPLSAPLPPLPPEPDVELGRLVDALLSPASAHLRQRLDVAASSRTEEPDPAMPVELDALQQWSVGSRVLEARLRGTEVAVVRARERARGELPPGAPGDALLREVGRRVDALVAAAGPHLTGDPSPVDVEVDLPSGRRLLGTVADVRGDRVVTVTYSSVRPKQRLRAWTGLLALTAARPGTPWRAVVVGRAPRDRTCTTVLGPVEPGTALALLDELVAVRDAALREPLPLPVATAEAYAAARHRQEPPSKARTAASKTWTSDWDRDREDREPEHLLLWDGQAAFDDLWAVEPVGPLPGRGHGAEPSALARLACRVWTPLLEHETTGYA